MDLQPRTAAVALDRAALAWRAGELALVFLLLPLAVRAGLLPGPRLLLLAGVTAAAVAVLHLDPAFRTAALWSGRLRGEWSGVLLRSGVAALVIAGLVVWLQPARLLAMPRERPALWLAGLLLYPLLSAWPQEVLYRLFFFRRYAVLFGHGRGLVVASGLAFAALHLVYPNLVAPLLSLPAGLVLAWRFQRAGALGPVWLEHAVYGLLLFSLGLGDFFYDGRG
ncbi:MAG: CPBP family intramembrane metalloprotease [Anaeromyxobacteraceae bacterium]|nr:CPBP family intramembrane metalloprotease [Anaeromyxobacteraceae bacterium]